MAGLPHAGTAQANDPLRFGRETKLSPRPKDFRVQGSHIRTLAIAQQATVLTALDATTFEVRKQVRRLPFIHKILVAPDGFSLGYRQRHAGHPAELHFIDPDLHLAGSCQLPQACAVSHQSEQWLAACQSGDLHCFHESGRHLWTWRIPLERYLASAVFHVAATGDLILAAQGLYLYALTPRGELLWIWEVPNRQAQTHGATWTLPARRHSDDALQTLGLHENATADEVRRAYRRMARLTHPDFHPHDALAAARFRAVREAYQAVQGARGTESAGALHVRFSLLFGTSIRSLSVHGTFVAVGTNEGNVYLCGHDGKVLRHHADPLGRRVDSILLCAGGILAVYCYPHLFRLDEGVPRSSDPITEYSVQLIACGEDILLWSRNQMWLFDRQARVRATRIVEGKIDGVASSATETILLSGGHLYAMPHR